jgi:TRAP-type mannitol/chloroaromatic compound transport system substrate-binding protein
MVWSKDITRLLWRVQKNIVWEDFMDRRSFLRTSALGGAAAAASTLAAPAISQNRITWRMVTTWGRNFPGLGTGAQRLADRITAASGGRLTVELFAAGEVVPALQSLDAVLDGAAEMSHGAAYYWQNRSVGLSFFTGVPFGMTSRELSAWVRFGGGQEIWDDIYDQFGLVGLLSGDTGTQAGGWFNNELNGIEDIQGIRFRTPGLGGQVWQKMGASVTNMAGGEIFAALQSGTLDAAEFVGPTTTALSGSIRSASTITPRLSSSRGWRRKLRSTRRNSLLCLMTCRQSSVTLRKPNTTTCRRSSTSTTRSHWLTWWITTA